MESLPHRLFLVALPAAIALHFPELISWKRLRSGEESDAPSRCAGTLGLLRRLLRVEFFFYILLLTYAYHSCLASPGLIYPLLGLHLAGLIAGERDLPAELRPRGWLARLIGLILVADAVEIALLALIGLEMHGIVSL